MLHGDFSELAENYTRYRPGYSQTACRLILDLVGKPADQISVADVGAGTGIWSRELAAHGVADFVAIEPNDQMREQGKKRTENNSISWLAGSGEKTGLAEGSVDLLTMASSFHWTNFDDAIQEFHRVLKPNGCFAALWNTRRLEASPLLQKIEAKLQLYAPNINRVSSGRSEFCGTLTQRFMECPLFEDVVQINGYHRERMTIDRYIGIWRSVNDIPVQIGEDNFAEFLDFIGKELVGLEHIVADYETRAWVTRRTETNL